MCDLFAICIPFSHTLHRPTAQNACDTVACHSYVIRLNILFDLEQSLTVNHINLSRLCKVNSTVNTVDIIHIYARY